MNEVPIGTIGEIYIGGVGLARGYVNQPSLTACSFIANPFSQGKRLYKTGDLARYLEDGNIEFIGRVDHQVKIRGFRVELGEIESVLSENKDIKSACVTTFEKDVGTILVAYVVPNEFMITPEEVKIFLQDKLPNHMQPNQVIILKEFPLTANGKLDRQALPVPEGREGMGVYQEPDGELERRLASIWSELLGIEKIGRDDNFFSLGGDSIMSIQLVSRARAQGIHFEVKQVFETPTIQGLVANSISFEEKRIPQGLMHGEVGLLPIQQYFFEQKLFNENHYNQAMWFIPKRKLLAEDKEKLQTKIKRYL